MEDIAPKLLEDIQNDFNYKIKESAALKRIMKKIENGTATYADADDYAVEVGKILAEVYKKHLSSDILPDGKLYFNIANRVLIETMEQTYEMVGKVAGKTQKSLNKAAGIGIAAVNTPINYSRIMGIVNAVSAADSFDDVAYMLQEPVINLMQSVITENIRSNVEFHGKAGLSPRIERIARGDCCDWCSQLAGTYKYPKVPEDVYRRHRFCRCLVVYDPGNGSKENVHTKRQLTEEEKAAVERRKRFRNFKYQDVTPRYFGKAEPGAGSIKYQENYNRKRHANEINVAQLINSKFGGDITLLNESKQTGIKTPDFLWNDKLWELKTVTTEKAADTALRSGLKQIKENPGGVILDYRGQKVSLEETEKVVDGRMRRGVEGDTDIMIIYTDKKIKVYRYKK